MPANPIQFFEKRREVYPQAVRHGRYRTLKWIAMVVLLGIYYGAPWIRWDRGPGAPDQAILIDMAGRRAYWFGIEIWPQEIYYFTGLLILCAFGLFFVTSLFGRVWCGYACPQTVWTDLYMLVERWIQGDRNERIKRDKHSFWVWDTIWRKGLTHIIWILIAMATGGAWVIYYNDAPTLFKGLLQGHIETDVALWIGGLTLSTYVMAGLAREQVCTYMCPYARFQSAMFDKDTLIVGYDEARGEPRAPHKQGQSWDGRGHCIDCRQCVNVCPTGIDIRDGLQMQCIACGLCVDACNEVMDKVGLPKGLIRYDTENNQKRRDSTAYLATILAGKRWREGLHLIRARTLMYVVVMALVGGIILYGLVNRSPWEMHVLHDRNPLFVTLSDGSVRNNYTLKILNKSHEPRFFSLTLEGLPRATFRLQGAGTPDARKLEVPADDVGTFRVLVIVPRGAQGEARSPLTFHLVDQGSQRDETISTVFVSADAR